MDEMGRAKKVKNYALIHLIEDQKVLNSFYGKQKWENDFRQIGEDGGQRF